MYSFLLVANIFFGIFNTALAVFNTINGRTEVVPMNVISASISFGCVYVMLRNK